MQNRRLCANCSQEMPLSGWEDLCPRCLVRVSIGRSLQVETSPAFEKRPSISILADAGGQRFFGDYELLEEIGRGGMGVVFKARQCSLNRIVAVKIVLAGPLASGQTLERFRVEAEAVAQLHHPNIVPIYEAGQYEGTPFFSMQYVPGRTLADLVTQRPLSPETAARYVEKVAEAIHFAHQNGILHRDLKPSNILIDPSGDPRVTDFGLAKRIDVQDGGCDGSVRSAKDELTISGQVLGSPSYMAPEQVGTRRGVASPASDIYALGAILFHLLTGRPPFLAESLEGTLLQVLTTEPVGLRQLNSSIPRDLETICGKCLQKDQSRRYESAQALAEDLGRFLRREPVLARPVGRIEKVWRWCQRRPALASILLLFLLSLVAGFAGILSQWRRAERRQRELQQNLYATDVNLAQVALENDNVGRAVALLEGHVPKSSRELDLRGFEWRYLRSLCQGDEQAVLSGDGIVSCVRFSPDGRLLATAGFSGVVTIWDAASQQVISRLTELASPVFRLSLSFSPDGTLLAAAGGTNLMVWNTAGWKIAQRLEAQSVPRAGTSYQVLFAPHGGLLARLREDVQVWDTNTWQGRTLIRDGIDEQQSLLACAPDGRTLATFNDGHILIWDARTGEQRGRSVETFPRPNGLVFSPSGSYVAVADHSGKLQLLNPNTGETVAATQAHHGYAQGVAFSRDGKMLATCGTDHLVRLWDCEELRNIATLKGHRSEVWAVAFAPDGKTLASAGKDGLVRLWSVHANDPPARRLDGRYFPIWFSPNGRTLLTRAYDGSLHYWDTEKFERLRTIPQLRMTAERYTSTVSADGNRLATSLSDGRVLLWDLSRGMCVATNQVDVNPANALAFSPDAAKLGLSTGQYHEGAWHGSTKILHLANGQLETLSSDYSGYRDSAGVVFSPDCKLLAGTGPNYRIRLWDLSTKTERSALKGHSWDVVSLAFSPDGKFLASGSNDNTARLWDVSTGSQLAILAGHKTGVVQVGFSPDGRTLVTSGNDRTVVLWSVSTRRELITLRPATEWPHFVFSPDGHVLATGGMSGVVELWRAPLVN